jgi:DNA-binding transcriptional MerR regulator
MKNNLLTIKEMSDITGIASAKLRYWDERGRLVPVERTANGFRYYTEEQIAEALELAKKRTIVAYTVCSDSENPEDYNLARAKRENEILIERIRGIEDNKEILGIYEVWYKDIKNSQLERIIISAAKGLVSKLYLINKDELKAGTWEECKNWLSYMNTELIDINDVEKGVTVNENEK